MSTPSDESVSRAGQQAWLRLKTDKNWDDWIIVGKALEIGSLAAQHYAGKNKPEGKGYNMAFSQWLKDYEMDDLDKAVRSNLLKIIAILPQIVEWRSSLPLTDRLTQNHPTVVWRRWKARQDKLKPKPEEDKTAEPKLTPKEAIRALHEENHNLKQEIDRLKVHISDLEAALEVAKAAAKKQKPPRKPKLKQKAA